MSNKVIKIEGVSKQYYLGEIGTGTLSHDLHRWWAKVRGKENPYSIVGKFPGFADNHSQEFIWAIRDISLEVAAGDVLGIIGKNGAGKSTLLKLISRITAPTKGVIKARGRIASLLEVGTGMHPELTGRENIYLNGAILGMKRPEITSRFDDIVEFSGCGQFIDTPIKRYSSGMRVRLAFSVAAFLDAEILIVDEVLAVGDFTFQKKCMNKMKEISNKGRAILFVSHNIGAISTLCNRAIIMNDGMLQFDGNVEQAKNIYFNSIARGTTEALIPESDHPISISRVAVTEQSIGGNLFDIDESIQLVIDYEVKQEIKGSNIVIVIKDASGNIVFRSWDIDKHRNLYDNRLPGKYRARYNIRNQLLNIGTYFVSAACGQPSKTAFSIHDDVISFEVVATSLNPQEFSFSRGGILIAQGDWQIETIGANDINDVSGEMYQ